MLNGSAIFTKSGLLGAAMLGGLGWALSSTGVSAAETAPVRQTAAAAAQAAKSDPVDFSGVWYIDREGGQEYSPAPPLTPQAREYYTSVRTEMDKGKVRDDASARCIPPGVPRLMRYVYPTQFVRTQKGYITVHEFESQYRIIYMDGRRHPPLDELTPTFNGHSIAHWEGKTLVIDTVGLRTEVAGFNVEPDLGVRVSPEMHVIERYTLNPENTVMTMDITMIDPKTFTRPWVVQKKLIRHDEYELMEYECLEVINRQVVGPDGALIMKPSSEK